jgi:hypothetical protein
MPGDPDHPSQDTASTDPAVVTDDVSPISTTSQSVPDTPPYRTSVIELVSISATSSALPESFGLTISSKGRWLVAYSSAALYILLAEELPAFSNVCRAFRIRRKPLAVAITDVGKYAVLTSSYKIEVYECGDGSPSSLYGINRKTQTLLLNNEARTIAFSSGGEMVAAGSDQGIEMVGLGMGSGLNRRQINCGYLETVVFSSDGKSLLATAPARKSRTSTFLTISASFDQGFLEEEAVEEQPIGKQWISQLLFPEKLAARQAVFLPDPSNGQVSELIGFNPQSEQFGIFDTAMKMFNGKTLGIPDDVTWSRSQRFDDTLPAVSKTGLHIATAVRLKESSEIWTYEMSSQWREEDLPSSSLSIANAELTPIHRLLLPSRGDNAPPESIICLRWIETSESVERLLALINTVNLSMPEDVVPTVAPAASGKVMVFDFKQCPTDATQLGLQKVTINLDEFSLTENLADDDVNLEQEVDIVRRRTQVQRSQQRQRDTSGLPSPRLNQLRRSLSSSSRNGPVTSPSDIDPHSNRPRRRRSFSSVSDMSEDTEGGAIGIALDEPYSHSAPRSQFTLTRAATVAQNSPAARMHLRTLPNRPLQYRRADGMRASGAREVPHESDADDWVPPPPPYSETPDQPGPNAISLAVPEAVRAAVLQGSHIQQQQQRQQHQQRQRQLLTGQQAPVARMQSRVSRIIPNAPVPPTTAQNARNSRLQQPSLSMPANTSHNDRSIPTQSMSVRNRPHIIPRRPVSSAATVPQSASQTGPIPSQPAQPATQSIPNDPTIRGLSTSFTFPGGRGSVSGAVSVQIPRFQAQSHTASAPVTPVSSNRRGVDISLQQIQNISFPVPRPAIQPAMQSTNSPTSTLNPSTQHHNPSANRRVASVEFMRSMPPPSTINTNGLTRQSTEWSLEPTQSHPNASDNRPVVGRLSTVMTTQSLDYQPPTPSGRRQWWRMGNMPARSQPSAGSTQLSSAPMSSSRSNTLFSTPSEEKSKCAIQ